MNIISISKRRFDELKPLLLSREIFNTEGNIYEFNYRGNRKIAKKLFHQNGQVFANKLYTVEMLDSNKQYLPDCFCVADYLLAVSGKIEAFTNPYVEGPNLSTILHDKNVNPKEQLYYLKKIGEILQQMKNIRKYTPLKDIYLNDLHESNFIVNPNNRQLTVVDLDSCKIGTNDPFQSRFLTSKALLNNVKNKYKINDTDTSMGHVIADENSDIYCYIITILNYLYGSNLNSISINEFYEYMNYLEYIKFDKNLINCFEKILTSGKNENPLNYIDLITTEQIYRAKEVVYKKVKNI